MMTATPRLSIGLPVYNGEKYLREALDALLGQTFEDFELIISDNASTDRTSSICRSYQKRDSRIRYFRQTRNIGLAPNHNFVIEQARGELFKLAHHDDLYARDLLQRCVEALDQHPEAVLAYTWSAAIDSTGVVTHLIDYATSTSLPKAHQRFHSMLFDGWGDDYGGVVRLVTLRSIAPHNSYHFSDRVFTTELGLHGPFCIIPERLHFRRVHAEQAGRCSNMRERCTILDPRRGDRHWHPAVRLYGEYILGYVRAIRQAPLSPSEQRECYWTFTKWLGSRSAPFLSRTVSRKGLVAEDKFRDVEVAYSLRGVVAGKGGEGADTPTTALSATSI
jgi:glycosyltransferase involved in cell wall biosynthesis